MKYPNRWAQRLIRTLNPDLMELEEQVVHDISGQFGARCRVAPMDKINKIRLHYAPPLSFPTKTQGVLYYFQDPALPSISGEIHFRLCRSLIDFKTGSDLEIGRGEPWRVPLVRIFSHAGWTGLREILFKDGLVDRELVSHIPKFKSLPEATTLFDIKQAIVVDLDVSTIYVHLITQHNHDRVVFTGLYNGHYAGEPSTFVPSIFG